MAAIRDQVAIIMVLHYILDLAMAKFLVVSAQIINVVKSSCSWSISDSTRVFFSRKHSTMLKKTKNMILSFVLS